MALATARETVLKLRSGKGMVLDPEDHDTWSAGSFFTNPILTEAAYADFLSRVHDRHGPDTEPPAYSAGDGHIKTSAAWLIDKAGFTKGYGSGPVRISTKHTLALTNRGSATTADLLALAREVVAGCPRGLRRHPGQRAGDGRRQRLTWPGPEPEPEPGPRSPSSSSPTTWSPLVSPVRRKPRVS